MRRCFFRGIEPGSEGLEARGSVLVGLLASRTESREPSPLTPGLDRVVNQANIPWIPNSKTLRVY